MKWIVALFIAALAILAAAMIFDEAEAACDYKTGAQAIAKLLAGEGGTGTRHIRVMGTTGKASDNPANENGIVSFEYQSGARAGFRAFYKSRCLIAIRRIPLSEVVKIFGAQVLPAPGGDPA